MINFNPSKRAFAFNSILAIFIVYFSINRTLAQKITISETITDVTDVSLGSIQLTASGGVAPYTYLWSNGATTSTITGCSVGKFTVTVTDANLSTSSKNIYVQKSLVWTRFLNATSDGPYVEKLIKTSNAWNSGAVGNVYFQANEDGIMTYIADDQSTNRFMGLAVPGNNMAWNSLAYSIYFLPGNQLKIYESGVNAGSYGTYVVGDKFTILKEGNTVKYYRNSVLMRTKTITVQTNLAPQIELYTTNAHFDEIKTSANKSISIQGNIIDVNNTSLGSITANITGGTSPYSYLWSTGSTSSTISDCLPGKYTITVTDNIGMTNIKNIYVKAPLYWNNFLNSTSTGTLVTKTSSLNSWNSGASSTANFQANEDGAISYVTDNQNTYRFMGLAVPGNNMAWNSLLYSIYFTQGYQIIIYESGVNAGSYGTFTEGEKFSIVKEGNKIKYYRGDVLLRVKTITSPTILVPQVELYNPTSHFDEIRASAANSVLPMSISEIVTPTTNENLGSIALNVSGGLAPFSYLWELDELPTVAMIQTSLDTIPELDSLGLNADTIYTQLVEKYTNATFTDLLPDKYKVKISDQTGMIIEKSYYLGQEYNLAQTTGLTKSNNSITKVAQTSGFDSGKALLDNLVGHDSISSYFINFRINNKNNDFIIGLTDSLGLVPDSITQYKFGLLIQNGLLYKVYNGNNSSSLCSINNNDEITIQKNTNTHYLHLYQNNTLIDSLYLTSGVYQASLMLNQAGTIISALETAQLTPVEIIFPYGIRANLTHNTCYSEGSGAISFSYSNNIQNIQDILWTGPNSYTSNSLNITHLMPGDYSITFSYYNTITQTTTNLYNRTFQIGYYAEWLPNVSNITMLSKGGISNTSENTIEINSINKLESVPNNAWFFIKYQRTNTSTGQIRMRIAYKSNTSVMYSIYDKAHLFNNGIYINDIVVDLLSANGNNNKYYKSELISNSRVYSSMPSTFFDNLTGISYSLTKTSTTNTDNKKLNLILTKNQNIDEVVCSFGCPDVFPSYVVPQKILDGGFYKLSNYNGGLYLFFKYANEYKNSLNENLQYKIYTENLSSTPFDVGDLIIVYGDNRYSLNMSGYISTNKTYILEIINKKKESEFVKFKID